MPNKLLFFDIPLFCYVKINSSMICCLFYGDIHFSFGLSGSSKLFYEYNFYEDLDALVISFAILLPIKSLVASVFFFLIALFEAVFIASVVDFSVLSRSF